jgi:uncharacterized protein (TIGR03000 family)
MFQKALSYCGMLLLAGAVVFTTPGSGLAQHGGGHGGGGGHFSGGRVGGFGGARVGAFRGGFRGGDHYGNRHNYGYGYYPYLYGTYPYDSGYYGSYGDVTPSYPDSYPSVTPTAADYQSFAPPATVAAQPDNSAHVTVNVPTGTQLWFDGSATTTTGSVRQFDTPSLTPGSRYGYEIRARWNENGQEVTQTQQVEVRAGAHVNVSFPVPSNTTGQGSTVKNG